LNEEEGSGIQFLGDQRGELEELQRLAEEDEDEYGRRRTRKIGFDSDEEIGSESGEDGFSYSETE